MSRKALTKEELKFRRLIGKRIATIRILQGMNQTQLARKTDVSRPSLALYETGKANIPVTALAKLAAGLGITAGEILSGKVRPGAIKLREARLAVMAPDQESKVSA